MNQFPLIAPCGLPVDRPNDPIPGTVATQTSKAIPGSVALPYTRPSTSAAREGVRTYVKTVLYSSVKSVFATHFAHRNLKV